MTYLKLVWMNGLVEYYPNDSPEDYNAWYKEIRPLIYLNLRRSKKVNSLPENAKVIKMIKHNKGWDEE